MRVADYIAEFVYNQGVRHAFMVTGGGMMFLSDGVAAHPDLESVHTHHEQAAAMAAVAYAKYNQHLGACYVTTGCGGSNAMTGLLNGWQDSTPCLFISGQCKRKETVRNAGLPLRQLGVQEADIIALVEPITKYAIMINRPEMVPYHFEKALHIATSGRPGPVWLDIPMDVQGADIDMATVPHYVPEATVSVVPQPSAGEIASLTALLAAARRPVVIAGQGIRLGKAVAAFRTFIEGLGVPFVVSKLGVDLLPSAHPLFIGRIGNKGDRAGNLAVQNADLVLCLGCRLSVSSTGHEYHLFAREAKTVVVDIDPIEHKKNTVRIDMFIHADVGRFFQALPARPAAGLDPAWLERCAHWRAAYPVWQPEYADTAKGINLYHFVDSLSKALAENDVVVSDAGSAFYVVTQGLLLKEGMRLVTSGGQAEMGYTLPASIGVCYANGRQRVAAVTGDGSFQMNIQELQTIVHNRLPIKLFVLNNDGYLSIRTSQRKFFDGRTIGADAASGISFPDLEKIAAAYGLAFARLGQTDDLARDIAAVMAADGPVLCEVLCPRDQEIVPSSSAARRPDGTLVSKPLEDMYPFLDRETFRAEMLVTPVNED